MPLGVLFMQSQAFFGADSAVLLYAGVLVKLVQQWGTDPTYSHGVLVPPIALFLVYRQRDRLRQAKNSTKIFEN